MFSTPIRTASVALAALLVFATAGCKKEKSDRDGRTATGFAVFPADTEMVVGLSFRGLRASALWSEIEQNLASQIGGDLAEFKEACGFDPFQAVDSVLLGGSPDKEDSWVGVVKGIGRKQFVDCATKLAGKQGARVKVDDDLVRISDGDSGVWCSWLDDSTLVFSAKADQGTLRDRLAGRDGLDRNQAFMSLLKQVDSKATIWFAGMPKKGSEALGMLSSLGAEAEAVFGSVLIETGVALDVGLRLTTADGAAKLHTMAKQMLPMAGQFAPKLGSVVDKLELEQNGRDLIAKLNLTRAELDQLSDAMDSIPGLGGM